MIRRIVLSVVWLAGMALAAPLAPVAEAPPATVDPPAEAVVEPPAGEPVSQSPPEPVPPAAPVEAAQAPVADSVPGDPSADRAPADEPAAKPPPDRPIAVAAAPGSVTIDDFSFAPATITVGIGESVTWRNDGPSGHTATAADGSFDTGLLSQGESGSVTFDEAGDFSYLCTPHPFMKGTVRVVAQSSSGGETGSSGSGSTGTTGGSPTATSSQADGPTLPSTGASPGWLAVAGAGLLSIGLWGRIAARRRLPG